MHFQTLGFPPLSAEAVCRGARPRIRICVAWLAGLSVLLYGPVVGTGAAPAQVSPEVAQHVGNGLKSVRNASYGDSAALDVFEDPGGSWVQRGAAPPPVYRRKKAPPHQSARLIITVAIAAFALFIRRCVASLAKSRAAASRRSLADGDDDFQQCVGPSFPSRHKPAVASSGMDPVMYQRLRNVLLLQERAIGSIWRAFPRLISPDVVKFLNVVVVYYTFEQTLLSAFLPDQLERLRRDAAAQLLSLARFVANCSPHDLLRSRQVSRLRRKANVFSISRARRGRLPPMTEQERAQLLDQLLSVQEVTWALVYDAMLRLEHWTERTGGISLEQASLQAFTTVCGVLVTRRNHLLRIPEAVYCLNELQVTAGQSLLFGWEGVKKAAECGPLPDTQGQIDEVKKEVHRKQEFAVLTEEGSEGDQDETHEESFGAEGAFSSSSLAGDLSSAAETTRAWQALTGPKQPSLFSQFSALFFPGSFPLPRVADAPAAHGPHSSPAFPPRPLQDTAHSGYRTERSEGRPSSSLSATQSALQAQGHYIPELTSRGKGEASITSTLPATQGATQAPPEHKSPLLLRGTRGGTETTDHIQRSGDHSGVDDQREEGSSPVAIDEPFYGVPLGAPVGPWPPEGVSRPAGAKTPFDFSDLDFWAKGLSNASSGGSQGQPGYLKYRLHMHGVDGAP